jgi:two-component system phosphate regulon sensor histidine kinase PhoR
MKWKLFTSSRRSLEEVARVARRIAQGDFSQRLSAEIQERLGVLAFSINNMAENLQRQFSEIQQDRNRLAAILDGMVEGVLVTNEGGAIELVNPALSEILCLEEGCEGKTILECLRNKSIHEALEAALREGAPQECEISFLARSGEEKILFVHTAPLKREGRSQGTVSVFYDVTRIRSLENMRKEFVANVSHELKTPLTNILGYAETLRGGAIQDAEASARFVEKIENNALQLKNLVEDILKVSEIESGRLEMNPVDSQLENTVRAIQAEFEEQLKSKKLNFEIKIPTGLAVRADPSALRQILMNLIDNAVKYTPEGGRVTVSAEREGPFCKVTVADTGIGIAEKDLPHVFERFYRADKARSRQMGGTGLGLSIVKHFVQAHGGEVGATSEVGKGSQFFFTLPLA